MLLNYMKTFLHTLISLVYPPRCPFCSSLLVDDGYPVCCSCLARIPFTGENVCRYCGKNVSVGGRGFVEADDSEGNGKSPCTTTVENMGICLECSRENKYYDLAVCACEYTGLVRKALIEYKFNGKKKYLRILTKFLVEKIKKMTNLKCFDIILYVPIHERRLKERGFNQAERLAVEVAEALNTKCGIGILQKIKNTPSQSSLKREDRKHNVKEAFIINPGLPGCTLPSVHSKSILLIDDILTTGFTVNECARILKEAGAQKVTVAVVATGKGLSDNKCAI